MKGRRGVASGAPMSDTISHADVRKIAKLSRIRVEEAEVAHLAGELNGILGWIEQLQEVDVEGVEPMTSAVSMEAPKRADKVTDGGIRDEVLSNAPKEEDGFFVVPRSVE